MRYEHQAPKLSQYVSEGFRCCSGIIQFRLKCIDTLKVVLNSNVLEFHCSLRVERGNEHWIAASRYRKDKVTGVDSVVKKFEVVTFYSLTWHRWWWPIKRVIPRHTNRPLPQLSFPSKLTRWETNPEITGIISLCKYISTWKWFWIFWDLDFLGSMTFGRSGNIIWVNFKHKCQICKKNLIKIFLEDIERECWKFDKSAALLFCTLRCLSRE